MPLTAMIGALAIILMIVGFWIKDLVVWVLDTIIWLVWTYVAFNYVIGLDATGNTYIPTAVGLIGAGLVLVCIYKDFSLTVALLRTRRDSRMTYDKEQEEQKREIYELTRRKPRD